MITILTEELHLPPTSQTAEDRHINPRELKPFQRCQDVQRVDVRHIFTGKVRNTLYLFSSIIYFHVHNSYCTKGLPPTCSFRGQNLTAKFSRDDSVLKLIGTATSSY